ncbi:hypothetical protein NQ656_17650 [Acinetobacter baumannii]|nr:hypothetical protein [Acinetobacter baumannii]
MRKLVVMIAIGCMLSGCMTKETFKTLKDNVFEREINDYVDLNYPIKSSELHYLYPTVYDQCSDAIDVNRLSLDKVKFYNPVHKEPETRYVLKSSVDTDPLKKCVDKYLFKKQISNQALEQLMEDPYYKEYKDEPDVRKLINKAKSDNVITYYEQREILYLVSSKYFDQTLLENKIWYQEKIHDL